MWVRQEKETIINPITPVINLWARVSMTSKARRNQEAEINCIWDHIRPNVKATEHPRKIVPSIIPSVLLQPKILSTSEKQGPNLHLQKDHLCWSMDTKLVNRRSSMLMLIKEKRGRHWIWYPTYPKREKYSYRHHVVYLSCLRRAFQLNQKWIPSIAAILKKERISKTCSTVLRATEKLSLNHIPRWWVKLKPKNTHLLGRSKSKPYRDIIHRSEENHQAKSKAKPSTAQRIHINITNCMTLTRILSLRNHMPIITLRKCLLNQTISVRLAPLTLINKSLRYQRLSISIKSRLSQSSKELIRILQACLPRITVKHPHPRPSNSLCLSTDSRVKHLHLSISRRKLTMKMINPWLSKANN